MFGFLARLEKRRSEIPRSKRRQGAKRVLKLEPLESRMLMSASTCTRDYRSHHAAPTAAQVDVADAERLLPHFVLGKPGLRHPQAPLLDITATW